MDDLLDTIRKTLVPVHREGWRFIAMALGAALVSFWLLPDFIGWLFVVLAAWIAYFFRDPKRTTPLREGLVIAPADGVVSSVRTAPPPKELALGSDEARVCVSIFMNVFDVHVNRAPVDGRITAIAYIPGKFVNAELDKASEHNERQAFSIEMTGGRMIGVVQIAGLVARRIVRFVQEGDEVKAGQRIGLIRFGSRVDVWLPPGVQAIALMGQRAVAGETVIADMKCELPTPKARRG